jgi:antirestriction protein ArdC
VAYIQTWLERLKNDKKLVLQAASKAQRAAKLILGTADEDPEEPTPTPAQQPVLVEEDETAREYAAAEKSWLMAA